MVVQVEPSWGIDDMGANSLQQPYQSTEKMEEISGIQCKFYCIVRQLLLKSFLFMYRYRYMYLRYSVEKVCSVSVKQSAQCCNFDKLKGCDGGFKICIYAYILALYLTSSDLILQVF